MKLKVNDMKSLVSPQANTVSTLFAVIKKY